jgi:hypothetical protein
MVILVASLKIIFFPWFILIKSVQHNQISFLVESIHNTQYAYSQNDNSSNATLPIGQNCSNRLNTTFFILISKTIFYNYTHHLNIWIDAMDSHSHT